MSVKTIFAATALAASSLVNAVVIPVRQVAGSEQTCVDQNPGHKYVTRLASNVQYEVICGADYYGSDLADGIKWPGSFEGCLAACDANTECKAISWANGPCYLKGGVPTLTTGNDAVWTAMKNPAPSCEGEVNSNGASYITSAGNFEIMCQQDYAGGDLPYNTRVNSFAECIDYCAADEKCIDVSYEYGACYPKKELGNLVPKGSVWTAKLTVPRAGASPSPSPVASEATSSPTPTPEVAKALTCDPNSNNNPTAYKNFAVQCFYDHAGADMGAYPETTTFESCMDACEANGECVAVSWVYGTCWMKNAANPGPSDVGHVWGAARPARVVSSSVVVEPSVTPSVSASADAQITPSVSASVDAQITPSAGSESSVVSSATITPAADSTPSPADSSSATPTPSELSTLVTVSLIDPTPAPAPTDV